MTITKKQAILDLLIARGAAGVSAHEATYQMGITRMAAIVHELKDKHGYDIRSVTRRGEQARYYLVDHRRPGPPPCKCGHLFRHHVSGMRCMAELEGETRTAEAAYCQCQKYSEQKLEVVGGNG